MSVENFSFQLTREDLISLVRGGSKKELEVHGGVAGLAQALCTNTSNGLESNHDFQQRKLLYGMNNFSVPKFSMNEKSKMKQSMSKEQFKLSCLVVRQGLEARIPMNELLVGDVVILRQYDMVPADGILIASNLIVDECLFNCCTLAAGKIAHRLWLTKKNTQLDPFLYSRSHVIYGEATMLVTCVGDGSSVRAILPSIQYAVFYECYATAKEMLKIGMSLDVPAGQYGYMMIHFVTKFGNEKMLQFMLAQGANVNVQTLRSQRTALQLAIVYRQELVPLLLAKSELSQQDKYGDTSLAYAIQHAEWPLIKMLLEKGANITATNHMNQTMLHCAVLYGFELTIAELLKYKAVLSTVNAQDAEGNTALFYACVTGRCSIVDILVRAGADVNVKNHLGQNCLHALMLGDLNPRFCTNLATQSTCLLFTCGNRTMPVLTSDAEHKYKALPSKIKYSDLKSVCVKLLSFGIDANASDKFGLQPIHYAMWSFNVGTRMQAMDMFKNLYQVGSSPANNNAPTTMQLEHQSLLTPKRVAVFSPRSGSQSRPSTATMSRPQTARMDAEKQRESFFYEALHLLITNGALLIPQALHTTDLASQ